MATTDIYTIQGSLVPTRRALRFLGGDVDDGVQVDALIAAIVAADHTHGTITAWIMCPDIASTYTIFGAGDANAVEYMEFKLVSGKPTFKVVDNGPSTRVDVATTSVAITPHKWHHVALVQDAKQPKIYVDGVEQALTYATATEKGQWFDDTDAIDGAHIGASDSVAGGGLLTNEFKGYISDFKMWSGTTTAKALTAAQVIDDMNGVSVSGALAWYDMDVRVTDLATGGGTYDGTIVGALIYVDACEFASRLSFLSGVHAEDNAIMSISGDRGFFINNRHD